jgi:hypothetical protein
MPFLGQSVLDPPNNNTTVLLIQNFWVNENTKFVFSGD